MFRPMTKETAAIIRNSMGAFANHMPISFGGICESYLEGSLNNCGYRTMNLITHIDDLRHVNPSRLHTAEDTLNTSERNQKRLTAPLKGSDASACNGAYVNWSVVAVTLEKKVAMVVRLTYRVVSLSI